MAPRILLIVNPISGTRSKDALIPRLERRIRQGGMDVTTRLTAGKGDATTYANEAVHDGYDIVAVCGGDGTVNETARAMCGTGVPMAIIPSGSGNGLARHIGLTKNELAAVDIIRPENVLACDYGQVNGVKFFCTFGVGYDAAVAHKFAAAGHRGLATYVRSAVSEFNHYTPRPYTITIDGDKVIETRAYCVTCCNASQYGNNVMVAPKASIADGQLDIMILRDASHAQTLMAGLDMLTGMLPYNRQVDLIKARSVDITSHEERHSHIDGDPTELGQEFHVEVVPGALQLYVSPHRHEFMPVITPIENVMRDLVADINNLFGWGR